MIVSFDIPGPPVGKGRPRVASRGGHARLYTPEKTASYESLVALAARAVAPAQMLDQAVGVVLDIRVPIPASWSKKKQAQALAGLLRPTTKPDIDNVEKAVFDGLNGVLWRDDVLVVEVTKRKRYDALPGVGVTISTMENMA